MQLVTDRVHMLNPAKDDTWYDPAKVKEFMGVEPSQVADLLALKGDAVDNIPGAPGIGDKGAKDLIRQFGSVEAALDPRREVVKQNLPREPRKQSRAHRAQQAPRNGRLQRSGGFQSGRLHRSINRTPNNSSRS